MKYLIIFIAVTCCSCHRQIINPDLDITIEEGSSLYDLTNNTLTVSYNFRADSIVKFQLLPQEKKAILQSYYDEELNTLPSKTDLKDSCDIIPKVGFDININDQQRSQKIYIYYSCDKYEDQKNAQRVKNFLSCVLKILRSKPEIKKAPESDVMYL